MAPIPEEQLFKTEGCTERSAIAAALGEAADGIESGDVRLVSDSGERTVTVPATPRFEVELERLTDSETGEQRDELEDEIRWTTEGTPRPAVGVRPSLRRLLVLVR